MFGRRRGAGAGEAEVPLVAAPTQQGMEVSSVEAWSAEDVAQYFAQKGYQQYRALFVKHELTGKRAIMLTPSDIEKMGIEIIGHRLGIQTELRSLKSTARAVLRNKVVSVEKEAFEGSCAQRLLQTCCGLFPLERDEYVLTTTSLKIKAYEVARCCFRMKCPCMGGMWSTDNIPLQKIVDVDTMLTTHGMACCSEHKCTIILAVSAGTGAESDLSRIDQKTLFVDGDRGESFASRIQNQIEEYKVVSHGDADLA